ncbi:DUF2378 family protein [Pyxidicoccus fallax]|uniref:DUF2378 family protein n=1 Tax=Pyxidicoccus fallax TaxID=394095 RepID=A0A848LR26_9BACT|nr:DUF2378 family protein [Pyxidicoccus fallax]NMO20129.1 DUF2378 family protein [Pyxidicoccus fallax]NPC80830.1 DUF2378 family protein [Pyxidicoccus fallax]
MGQDTTRLTRDAAPMVYGAVDRVRDLEHRLVLATPDKTCRGMFLKGVLQVVKSFGDDAAVARCLAASGQTRITDFASYPIADRLRMSWAAAEYLAPRVGGFEAALRLLGRQATADFMASLAGRTILALTNRDVVKMINSLPTAFGASVNYGKHTVEWSGPKSGRFLLEGDLMPEPINSGIMEVVLAAGEVKGGKVQGLQLAVDCCECVFSWE